MSENLKPPAPAVGDDATDDIDSLRLLSRSPHPYHRQNFELLQPSDQLVYRAKSQNPHDHLLSPHSFSKEATPSSDSGTEADDEHFLKGLPAPKARLHKGLRGKNEPLSGSSTPLLTPVAFEDDLQESKQNKKKERDPSEDSNLKTKRTESIRKKREIIRRSTEVFILGCLGGLVGSSRNVRPTTSLWKRELLVQGALAAALLLLYPIRLVIWAYRQRGKPSKRIPIAIPSSFDPAPMLYPPTIPLLVSLLISVNLDSAVLPNLVLSLCAIPGALIPTTRYYETHNPVHWMLSLAPVLSRNSFSRIASAKTSLIASQYPEVLVMLYPLHQTLCRILHHLTTTSLLPAELQLLSVALINILLLARSPQVVILKGLLWIGGLGVTILCGPAIRWGIALARVPKWRFRRLPPQKKVSVFRMVANIFSMKKMKYELLGSAADESLSETGMSTDEEGHIPLSSTLESMLPHMDGINGNLSKVESVPASPEKIDVRFNFTDGETKPPARRFTLPISSKPSNRSKTHTPSGRRKRSASSSVRSFFTLTQAQATLRKWLYATWVYICIISIILLGVREYVQRFALNGEEPVGWALGYMFGGLPWFRFQVVKANLERWICLPALYDPDSQESCHLGWVQYLRHASFGEANTRLILSAYWLAIVVVGLAVVFQLSPIYEVDTRRKIFHFMMVAMFLPATFVDPTYAALALSLILAIFLLLDLLRASQLPPLSKPIAAFLTPYVDGRDLRGPVVISHIFLLIGCAIPLWLSLASLPRTGSGYLQGWEVPTREVSMVAGVICVGLGDAAASLIGRRWGVRKWLWRGGKSLEGSVAFAMAVFIGLMAANVWLRIGGWPMSSSSSGAGSPGLAGVRESLTTWNVTKTIQQTGVCASMASLTEAVLTGGNDNVVVPVVLWTCVKSFGI